MTPDSYQELIQMIRQLRNEVAIIRQAVEQKDSRLLSLPETAKLVGIGEEKLRQFAQDGSVRAIITKNNAKRIHYRFNPTQVKSDLLKMGYLRQSEEKFTRTNKVGRTSTLDIMKTESPVTFVVNRASKGLSKSTT